MLLKGQKIDWEFVGTWSFRLFITGVSIGGVYAASVFVTKTDAHAMVEHFTPLPAKVERIEETNKIRDRRIDEMDTWRRIKDETDTRLTIIQDNQQRMLERQQMMMDRQQNQIDELNRRK